MVEIVEAQDLKEVRSVELCSDGVTINFVAGQDGRDKLVSAHWFEVDDSCANLAIISSPDA